MLNYKKSAFWLILLAIVICIVVAVCFLTNPKKDPISFDTIQITWANALGAGGNRAEAPGNKGRLSLNDVIMLSQKGKDLSWEDFEQFSYVETGSGLYIRVYKINPLFSLWIGGSNPDNEPMYISLRINTEPEDAIDIRTEDVAAFISKHRDDRLTPRLQPLK